MTMAPPATITAREVPSRPKVVYIMGAGRSGSTILGVSLGNCADLVYAGELDKWPARSGRPEAPGAEQERFWGAVRSRLDGTGEGLGPGARSIDRSSALFRLRDLRRRRRARPSYRRNAAALYRAVAVTAGVGRIVDTSHYPLRARELQALSDIDLYLVLLVRDPHGVVASFGRRDVPEPTFGVLKTNAYLWLTHLLSLWVFLHHSRERRMLVRYEDFVACPQETVARILALVGSNSALPDFSSLKVGVPFVGNRLVRGDETLAIRGQPGPRPRRSPVTSLLQLPWSPTFSLLERRRRAAQT
jgi:sulfotransferase family protein